MRVERVRTAGTFTLDGGSWDVENSVWLLGDDDDAPGAVCLYAPALGAVFTGDTLFHGGPGATGRSFSDRGQILASIRDRLLTLDDATVVHTDHGDDTTIGAERAGVEAALREAGA